MCRHEFQGKHKITNQFKLAAAEKKIGLVDLSTIPFAPFLPALAYYNYLGLDTTRFERPPNLCA